MGVLQRAEPGLFLGKNSSRHLNYRMMVVPPSAPDFLAFRRDHVAGRTGPHTLGQTPRKILPGKFRPSRSR